MIIRHRLYLPGLVLLLAAGGCNRSELVNATGRLTYKGQPVPSTYVKFQHDEEGKRDSIGLTEDDGRFTLQFSRTQAGVYRGQHTVYLSYYISAQEELREIPPKASKELKAVIAKYGDVKTSPLRYEVTTNGQHFEIELQ